MELMQQELGGCSLKGVWDFVTSKQRFFFPYKFSDLGTPHSNPQNF